MRKNHRSTPVGLLLDVEPCRIAEWNDVDRNNSVLAERRCAGDEANQWDEDNRQTTHGLDLHHITRHFQSRRKDNIARVQHDFTRKVQLQKGCRFSLVDRSFKAGSPSRDPQGNRFWSWTAITQLHQSHPFSISADSPEFVDFVVRADRDHVLTNEASCEMGLTGLFLKNPDGSNELHFGSHTACREERLGNSYPEAPSSSPSVKSRSDHVSSSLTDYDHHQYGSSRRKADWV